MYVCMDGWMDVYMYIYICIYTYIYIYIYIYIWCNEPYVYKCTCVYMCVCVYIHTHIYIYMYIHIHRCICVWIYNPDNLQTCPANDVNSVCMHSCHILPFQILWNKYFSPEPAKTAKHSPKHNTAWKAAAGAPGRRRAATATAVWINII